MAFRPSILFLSLCMFSSLNGQKLYELSFGVYEKLPSTNLTSVNSDNQGNIWFSSDKGVSKYNSYVVTNYSLPEGLPDNDVHYLFPDRHGKIWVFSTFGRPCYILNETIHTPELKYISSNQKPRGKIIDALENLDETYWLTNKGEIYFFRNDSILYVETIDSIVGMYNSNNAIRCNSLTRSFTIANGKILYTGGLENNLRGKQIHHSNNKVIIQYDSLVSIFKSENGELKLLHQTFETSTITSFAAKDHHYFVGTKNGLRILTPSHGELTSNREFEGCEVSGVLIDFQGNLWLSCLGQAAIFVPSLNILRLRSSGRFSNSKSTSLVTTDENGNVWFAHDNGHVTLLKGNLTIDIHLINAQALNKIHSLRTIGNDVWLCSEIGIWKLNSSGGQEYFPIGANDILIDKDDNYWIASNHLYKIPVSSLRNIPNSNSLLKYQVLDKKTNILKIGPKGNIWVGMQEGLICISKGRIIELAQRNSKLQGRINDIAIHPLNGNIIVATGSYGVIEVNPSTFEVITENSQFSQLGNIGCFSIVISEKKCWLGTTDGIVCCTLDGSKSNLKYSRLLGLQYLHVYDLAISANTLFASTSHDLLQFNNTDITETAPVSPRIFINSASKLMTNDGSSFSINLSYNNPEVTIQYSGLSYLDRGTLRYKYKLDGYDQDFQYTSNRELAIKGLSPGDYTFIIYALSSSGLPSTLPATIAIHVSKPYWQKWWFISLSSILSVGIVFVVYKVRIAIVLKRAKNEEDRRRLELTAKLQEVEQHALRLQMNPHFIFNALNSIKGYYADKEFMSADQYLTRFSKILRYILENGEQYSYLKDEIKILQQYLELSQMRHPGLFTFEIDTTDLPELYNPKVPTLIYQPFVENAIIHGLAPKEKGGFIQVKFKTDENFLICSIIDNGIGFSYSISQKSGPKSRKSKAIEISKKRLRYLSEQSNTSSDIQINDHIIDGQIAGTIAIIRLPKETYGTQKI